MLVFDIGLLVVAGAGQAALLHSSSAAPSGMVLVPLRWAAGSWMRRG